MQEQKIGTCPGCRENKNPIGWEAFSSGGSYIEGSLVAMGGLYIEQKI